MHDCPQNTSPPSGPSPSQRPVAPEYLTTWDELQPFRETALLAVPLWLADFLRKHGRRLHSEALESFGIASESTAPVNLDCIEAAGRDLHHLKLYLLGLSQSHDLCHLDEIDVRMAVLATELVRHLEEMMAAIEAAVAQEQGEGDG